MVQFFVDSIFSACVSETKHSNGLITGEKNIFDGDCICSIVLRMQMAQPLLVIVFFLLIPPVLV